MNKFSIERLCSAQRLASDGTTFEDENNDVTPFHQDAGRIIASSAFRRLQGKTQVYPFPQNDFVRNRLTHTNEVAHIGRTISHMIATKSGMGAKQAADMAQIVTNACYLHDIGNPPFGHSGESSIREFFSVDVPTISLVKNVFDDAVCERDPTARRLRQDLVLFDGNAQGLRVATCLAGQKGDGGLRLTAGTLTAMVKYAYDSLGDEEAKGKFGFLSTEFEYARKAFEACGLYSDGTIFRNPLSLIVEAADDIAYLTSDVQDAYNNSDIPFDTAKTILQNLSSEVDAERAEKLDQLEKDYQDKCIGFLRSAAVSYMTKAAAEILVARVFSTQVVPDNDFDLWKQAPSQFHKIRSGEEQIRAWCDRLVYRGKRKTALQVAGGRVIKFVLQTQLTALNEIFDKLYDLVQRHPEISSKIEKQMTIGEDISHYVEKLITNIGKFVSRETSQIFWGMPSDCHDILKDILLRSKRDKIPKNDPRLCYEVIQISVDFVAGTTDRYLSDYSRQWSGPSIS